MWRRERERKKGGETLQNTNHIEKGFIPIFGPRSSPLYDPLWEVCEDTEKRLDVKAGSGLPVPLSPIKKRHLVRNITLECPFMVSATGGAMSADVDRKGWGARHGGNYILPSCRLVGMDSRGESPRKWGILTKAAVIRSASNSRSGINETPKEGLFRRSLLPSSQRVDTRKRVST